MLKQIMYCCSKNLCRYKILTENLLGLIIPSSLASTLFIHGTLKNGQALHLASSKCLRCSFHLPSSSNEILDFLLPFNYNSKMELSMDK